MRIFKRKGVIAITAFILITALVLPAYADITQSDIDDALAVKAQEEEALASTEERLNELEQLKGNNEAYLNELSNQLDELSGQLDSIRVRCAEKDAELEKVRSELAEQNALADEQYEDMKVRIQYMYEETTNTGILESLFSAESFTDFINRAETMSELNRYDRDMLDSYSRTISEIESKKEQLIKEQEELIAAQEQLTSQQAQIQEIYHVAYDELRYYTEQIEVGSAAELEIIARIRQQQESIDYLMAQAYEEEVARQERAAAEAAAAQAQALAAAQAQAAAEAAQAAQEQAPENQAAENGEPYYQESADQEAVQEQPAEPVVADTENVQAEEQSPAPEEVYVEESEPAAEPAAPASSGGTYLGNFTLTAYCGCAKCCGQWASANPTTASGAPCVEGVTVAMGGVPFGTKLLINGNVYIVQDRGTSYGHVDIYFNNHSDASAFGLKHADVYQVE